MKLIEDKQRVLKWNRPMKRFHDIDASSFGSTDPIGKIHIIGYGGTEHDQSDMLW